jgi:tRNA(Ile)-lysidine synthetase-like protein
VRREFEWLVIDQVLESGAPFGKVDRRGFSYRLRPPCEVSVPELALRLRFQVADMSDAEAAQIGYNKINWVWLDPSRLGALLILRNWRPGDRVKGRAKRCKVKDLFQRRRVPIAQRPYWPVLEADGEIIWARGFEGQFEDRPPSGYRLLISEEQCQPDAGGQEHK